MSANIHPILEQYLDHLPENLPTRTALLEGRDYAEVAAITRADITACQSLEGLLAGGHTVRDLLHQHGSRETLDDPDALDKDRLRLLGVLRIIADFCEAMDEE